MKVIRLKFSAAKKGGHQFTQVNGTTVCLNCASPVKRTIETQAGAPVEVLIQPATQAQLRHLLEVEKHPLLEEVEVADAEPKTAAIPKQPETQQAK